MFTVRKTIRLFLIFEHMVLIYPLLSESFYPEPAWQATLRSLRQNILAGLNFSAGHSVPDR